MLAYKKLLFVSSNISSNQTGGGICSARNLDMCIRTLGTDNIKVYALKSFSIKGFSILQRINLLLNKALLLLIGYSNGSSRKIDKEILEMVRKEKVNFVFIDSSLNGHLVEKLRKETQVTILCFFHNCERSMLVEQMKSGNIFPFLRIYSIMQNERKTCKYANRIIVLNKRDYDLVNRNYKRIPDSILPISLKDTAMDINFEKRVIGKRKKGLFVGSFFFGNVVGLKYFIQEVLPHVNMQLIVVGKGMSNLNISNSNVSIFDGVESLKPYYLDADVVIAPIVTGGGMKVKIAEAMMYGKKIIGTIEAFQGYEDIPCASICKDTQEFIQAINNLSGYSYNSRVREHFKEKYETYTLMSRFESLFVL